MKRETKARKSPGVVGGNFPADPLGLGLWGRRGVAGAGLRGRLPPRSLGRGSQARAAGTTHITTGLLLLDNHNSNMTIRTCKQQKKVTPHTLTTFHNN